MDFSPVIISLKTATQCAAHCLSRRNPCRLAGYEYSKTAAENRNGQSSDIVGSAPYSGRPLLLCLLA